MHILYLLNYLFTKSIIEVIEIIDRNGYVYEKWIKSKSQNAPKNFKAL